ncbi:MAG: hypothetical protein ACJAUP_001757 [Cellvibrionaceae bacterium]|jgi:hypothetical protein
MNLALNKEPLPSPRLTAHQIKFIDNKFNDYPYLILALLDRVPQLRGLSDEDVIFYHNSVRKVLIGK